MSKQTITFIVSIAASILLAACSAAPSVDSVTPLPQTAVMNSSTSRQATAETHTSLSFDCQNIPEPSMEECQALVAFYQSTNGDHWQDNSGWLVDETPCTWYGVMCEQGHVYRLYLTHNQLSGWIPATLGNLSGMSELDLSFNQLTGSIPAQLTNLTALYRLDLSYNRLTGAVPSTLAEAPIPDLSLWGNQLDGTVWASDSTITAVEYQGVKFELDSRLAESVWPEMIAARPPVSGEFDWYTRPEHIRFTFASHNEPERFQGGGMNISGYPQIFIYPTQTFSAMDDIVKGKIETLQTLLEVRRPVPENEIPVLPLINAAQVFHAQVQDLDFQNGSGVRFITHYSQEVVGRLTEDNIFYTFQGLTCDGAYYIAAFFPISADGLNDQMVDEPWDTAEAHLAQDIQYLDSLSSRELEPDLDLLDNIVQSLIVDLP